MVNEPSSHTPSPHAHMTVGNVSIKSVREQHAELVSSVSLSCSRCRHAFPIATASTINPSRHGREWFYYCTAYISEFGSLHPHVFPTGVWEMVQRVTARVQGSVITTVVGSPCISRKKAECASLLHRAYWSGVPWCCMSNALQMKMLIMSTVLESHAVDVHSLTMHFNFYNSVSGCPVTTARS